MQSPFVDDDDLFHQADVHQTCLRSLQSRDWLIGHEHRRQGWGLEPATKRSPARPMDILPRDGGIKPQLSGQGLVTQRFWPNVFCRLAGGFDEIPLNHPLHVLVPLIWSMNDRTFLGCQQTGCAAVTPASGGRRAFSSSILVRQGEDGHLVGRPLGEYLVPSGGHPNHLFDAGSAVVRPAVLGLH